MKTITRTLFLSVAAVTTLALAAATKPNFSGDWEFNVAKSDLGGAPITKVVVHIDHKDPVFKYTAKGTADGQDFEESETIATDGTPSQNARGATVKAGWNGTTLSFESRGTDGQLLDDSRLKLAADGKTIIRDFESMSSGEPQKRHEIYEEG